MIFLDANVILRYLVPATTANDRSWKSAASRLFAQVVAGETQVTTSEVVLHEVCYVLGSPRQYGYSASQIAPALRSLIRSPGFVVSSNDMRVYLRALELWEQHPQLEFSDSVIAARCERGGHKLATFDGHFEQIRSITLWQPESGEPASPA